MSAAPGARVLLTGLALAVLAGCGGGGTATLDSSSQTAMATSGAMTSSSTPVQNHVHGAVTGRAPADILLGTHFGLRLSRDAGATWTNVPGTGGGMIAAIAKVPTGYSAAMMPMGTGGSGGSAMGGSGGAAMGGGSTAMSGKAHLMYSADGMQWSMAMGVPDGTAISNLAASPAGSVDWASVTGKGIYRSADGGRTWTLVVPTTALITALLDTGPALVVGTPDGLGVTSSTQPAMPPKPALTGSFNTVSRWFACPTCLVASPASGGVAISRDGGATWRTVAAKQAFDSVSSFASSGTTLFGMVASPIDPTKGLWRSTDSGQTWTEVLSQPQVDYMYEVPAAGSAPAALLAFQWGIVEWRSTDGGATWSRLATL